MAVGVGTVAGTVAGTAVGTAAAGAGMVVGGMAAGGTAVIGIGGGGGPVMAGAGGVGAVGILIRLGASIRTGTTPVAMTPVVLAILGAVILRVRAMKPQRFNPDLLTSVFTMVRSMAR
jgi:hypothetical protein